MVRKPRQGKTSSRNVCDRKASSRKPADRKTAERKTAGEKLELLQAELQTSMHRIDRIERRLAQTDQAMKTAISGLTKTVGELNVRLTAVAANVFEVIAMATEAAERSEQDFRPSQSLNGEIKL